MNWDIVCYVLKKFGITHIRRGEFNSASKLMLLDGGAVDLPGVIYVTAGGGSDVHFRYALIVSVGACCIQTDNCVEVEAAGLSEVFNALAETKHYLDTLDNVLVCLDTDQEIIDAAGMYLNCPLFYFDESYRVLAITRDVTFPMDEEWRHMLDKGFLSPENARKMKENGDLDLLAAAQKPVIYKSEIYPYTSVVTNVWYEGRFSSRINMLCIQDDPSPVAVRTCEILAKHLKRVISRSEKMPVSGPVRNMLMDLLRGVRLSESLISDRLQSNPVWNAGLFQVFCIDVGATHDKQVGAYYSAILDRLCTQERMISLVFEEKLVLVAHAEAETGFDALAEKLSAFFEVQHLHCGVSNVFRRLSALRGYYDQAAAALRLGAGEWLCFFRDHMLEHVLSFVPAEQAAFLISPDIERLMEADTRHALSLTETLRAYLACNCNLTQTAERLFIHKNTLLYRLHRIKSVICCDLNDADERLLLALSFKLMDSQT